MIQHTRFEQLMPMKRCLIFGLMILLVSGCLPNKKVVFLQKDDLKKKDLPLDSVVRNYPMQQFDYKIQSNDVLNIHFGSLTDDKYDFLNKMQQETGGGGGGASGAGYIITGFLVDLDGNIAFPVVGKVKVSGLTIFEIQELLQGLSNEYLESPTVRVRHVNFRFTVLGEVTSEGTTITYNNRVTMLEAIGLAGGMTDLADKQNVKLLRSKNGKVEVAYINLLSEDFVKSPYYLINQNDVLIVPPLKQRQFRKYFAENISIILATLTLALLIVNLTKN